MKHGWHGHGGLAILSGSLEYSVSSISEYSQNYTTDQNLLINAADAAERIMSLCVSVFWYICVMHEYACVDDEHVSLSVRVRSFEYMCISIGW